MPVVFPANLGLAADRVDALRRLCRQAPVALAVIFGSRARGQATATSDLNLLVLAASAAPFDLLGFEAEAQKIVGRPRVDLTLLHPALNSALAWEALRDAVILWEEVPGIYDREATIWHTRFRDDAPRRHQQAVQLTRMFGCP